MHPNLGPLLMFNENTVHLSGDPLVRTVRSFFLDKGITNDGFIERYQAYLKEIRPDDNPIQHTQKFNSDRKLLVVGRELPVIIAKDIVTAMGYDVVEFEANDTDATLTVINKETGEKTTYSSSSAS